MKTYTITEDQLTHLFETLSTEIGERMSRMDAALGEATNQRAIGNGLRAQQYVSAAHAELGEMSKGGQVMERALRDVRGDAPDAGGTNDTPATAGQGGESWSQFTDGTVAAASLSDADTSLYMGQSASNAFYWKGIVYGTADEMKDISNRWNHRGRFALDTPEKVAAYAANPTPLYRAYLNAGGKPLA